MMLTDYRYAFAGEACTGYDQGWTYWNAASGENTIDHVIQADDPNAPGPNILPKNCQQIGTVT